MSVTIQWCDGPRPRVKRPSHTACVDSACCAIATGCRLWIGMTAVPISTRDVASPMSAAAVSPSNSSGICGTQIEAKPRLLGGLGGGDELRDLVVVAAPLGPDHETDLHRIPFPPGPTLTGGRSGGNAVLVF